MNIEYHKWWSPAVGREMEFKVYGHSGKPFVVFPSSGGSFYEYEDFKMVEACQRFIDSGSIQIFTVESLDKESWLNSNIHHSQRIARHSDYERYILEEFTPYVRNRTHQEKFMATGCSLGAFHSLNFLLKHPDVFDGAICLSGVYTLRFSVGDYMDSELYYNSPLHYLPDLHDSHIIDQLRQSTLVVCSGQGAWEEETLRDTYNLWGILKNKNIPAWIDIWGHDVAHDWPWWRIQMPYILEKLGY